VIGRGGKLPWNLPEDLKIFKRLTSGHPIVMGRTTWESLPFKPLPNRKNIVISTSLERSQLPGEVDLFTSLPAFTESGGPDVTWLIGGASLYSQLLPACQELYLSFVYGEPEGDTHFPAFEHLFTLAEVIETQETFELRRYVRTPTG
ncbi:MAG: dihydrofolate reductase, partial [Verrucomicrobiales bacterium]|nr:dihydrofolate reductase [Verrucomicrobiales bacterium]